MLYEIKVCLQDLVNNTRSIQDRTQPFPFGVARAGAGSPHWHIRIVSASPATAGVSVLRGRRIPAGAGGRGTNAGAVQNPKMSESPRSDPGPEPLRLAAASGRRRYEDAASYWGCAAAPWHNFRRRRLGPAAPGAVSKHH